MQEENVHDSESFRTLPNDSEDFGTVPKASERKENHVLVVREVARMFEHAGVPRTERSITNWCQPDKNGVSRLDCYFDTNDRKYFITPQSVETVIAEEVAKGRVESFPNASESFGTVPNLSEAFRTVPKNEPPPHNETPPQPETSKGAGDREKQELKKKIRELKIENFKLRVSKEANETVAKEYERQLDNMLKNIAETSRRVGQLETALQLEAPQILARLAPPQHTSELDSPIVHETHIEPESMSRDHM